VAAVPAAVAGSAKAFVPAAFDAEGFARTAKMIFIRLQAANDSADLNDLRAFTSPEMFAELSMDLRDRPAGHQQTTEVVSIESEVLDVTDEVTQQVVSVRFRGQVREEAGAQPVAVDEVWHLTKPTDGSRSWAIAGIEQWAGGKAA
jgi:predicted lipid-binding transport protein (Tim44 family)